MSDVYDASLQTARMYTAGFNPNLEWMTFTDRFELHLQNWENRWGSSNASLEESHD